MAWHHRRASQEVAVLQEGGAWTGGTRIPFGCSARYATCLNRASSTVARSTSLLRRKSPCRRNEYRPGTYGLRHPQHRPLGEIRLLPSGFAHDAEVPLASVRTWQELVDLEVAEIYANLPADAFRGERAVSLTACQHGTFEPHGNHRTVAALLLGGAWLRARIRRMLVLRGQPVIE